MAQKILAWVDSALEDLKGFPEPARQRAGHQLWRVETGLAPDDAKPLPTVGMGVYEIRIHDDDSNQFRVVYVAKFAEHVYVLHCFSKKTQKTSQNDIDLAKSRYKNLLNQLRRSAKGSK